ncbi:hypothetical protein [Aureivirga sp. CE67]|uniref:hypothetical protein n=1 Tax=Aureivirga sp. CE67 TaxID=1788983 RepID=UPI0018CBB774|nr:hypothetical protein [Aureivirga sp. CE67]
MKQFIKSSILTAAVGLSLISCDDREVTADVLEFPGSAFAAFETNNAQTIETSSEIIEIVAFYANSNNSSNTTVDFSITENNITSADYEIVDGKSAFSFDPATRQLTDTLKVMVKDNAVTDDNKSLVFTLTNSNNNITFGYPGEAKNNSSFELFIDTDECALFAEEFGGTPETPKTPGARSEASIDIYNGDVFGSEVQSIVSSGEGTQIVTYKLTNLYNVILAATAGGTYEYPENQGFAFFTLDNSDFNNPTISIAGQGNDSYFATYDNKELRIMEAHAYDSSEYPASSFDTCGKTVTAHYVLYFVNEASENEIYDVVTINLGF